jgi:hypothetical protein
VGRRNRFQQPFDGGVPRSGQRGDAPFRRGYDAVSHQRDFVAQAGDHPEVMRYEQAGKAPFIAYFPYQVENPGLYQHVEAADRLVEDNGLRLGSECAGYAYPLKLSAAELPRKFVRIAVLSPTCSRRGRERSTAFFFESPRKLRSGSATIFPGGHAGVHRALDVLEHNLDIPAEFLKDFASPL